MTTRKGESAIEMLEDIKAMTNELADENARLMRENADLRERLRTAGCTDGDGSAVSVVRSLLVVAKEAIADVDAEWGGHDCMTHWDEAIRNGALFLKNAKDGK